MSEENELVLLTTATNQFEAHLLCGILTDHNIPNYIPGQNAADEFGAALRGLSVRIEVPRGCLEEAKEIVEQTRADVQARREAAAAEAEADDDPE